MSSSKVLAAAKALVRPLLVQTRSAFLPQIGSFLASNTEVEVLANRNANSPRFFNTSSAISFGETAASWSNGLRFASPESDFTPLRAREASVATDEEGAAANSDYSLHFPRWSGMLSFSAPESDFAAHDLLASYTQVAAGSSKASEVSLPRSFREALLMDDAGHRGHRRDSVVSAAAAPAIVVTTAEAPHRIVHVNRAWEDLCGYSRQEVLDGTLSVLQGPKTNAELADGAVSHLLATRRPVDMYQVNYKKSGEEFVNHVTMGPLPLSEESPDVEFLVAVLRQVLPGQVPLRMAAY